MADEIDNLHEELIADLMANPRTPRDHAAVTEILNLRAMLATLGYPAEEGGADLTPREGEAVQVEEVFSEDAKKDSAPVWDDIDQMQARLKEDPKPKKGRRDSGHREE